MLARLLAALHRWAESGWAGTATATWEVLQSSAVPGPSGAVFAPLAVADPERAPQLACWAVAGAVAGGCIAYLIGAQAFEGVGRPILSALGVTEATLVSSARMFERHGWLLVFVATISPLSTKLTCIAAGAFGLPIPRRDPLAPGFEPARELAVREGRRLVPDAHRRAARAEHSDRGGLHDSRP